MIDHPTITQCYTLIDLLKRYKQLEYDWEEAYDVLKNISTAQYRRLLALDYGHKVSELKEMLDQLKLSNRDLSLE